MQSKMRVEKTKQLLVQEERSMAGSLYTGMKIQWTGGMEKAVKMEFSLIPQGVEITRGSKCKTKRAAEWEESAVWKPLITSRTV